MARSTSPFAGQPALAWGLRALRAAGLVAALVAVAETMPRPGPTGRPLASTVCLVIAAVAWAGWIVGERRPVLATTGLGVLAAAGGVLAGLVPHPIGMVCGGFATWMAGEGLSLAMAGAITVIAELTLLVTQLMIGFSAIDLFGPMVVFAAGLFVGLIRARIRVRAEQAEGLLAQTQRARRAEAESAALAERGRIAREIHDVLAHALAALTMQLQAAHALLESDSLPAGNPRLMAAIGCVDRAERLAREGMAETRRAILALREDTLPLLDLLAALIRAHGDGARLSVTGDDRTPVSAEAALALYRTAQEALTNAQKHAPDAPVTVLLDYAADHVEVTVTNPAADPDRARPLTDTGCGYGLAGLRERAELAGGTLDAGPYQDGWRVRVHLPR